MHTQLAIEAQTERGGRTRLVKTAAKQQPVFFSKAERKIDSYEH
jgi:hypothetical protein